MLLSPELASQPSLHNSNTTLIISCISSLSDDDNREQIENLHQRIQSTWGTSPSAVESVLQRLPFRNMFGHEITIAKADPGTLLWVSEHGHLLNDGCNPPGEEPVAPQYHYLD